MNFTAWLASLVPGMVARVLAALGFGYLTVQGLDLAFDQVRGQVYASLGGLPADMMALAGLSGAGEGIGIILGAIAARVAYYALVNGTKLIGLPR